MNVSVAINVRSPNGEIIAHKPTIAISIKCWARQFESWNYGKYLTALCSDDSDCSKCDIKDTCEYSHHEV